MNLKHAFLPALLAGLPVGGAKAALLQLEFDGGSSEVTMAPGDVVQINVVWTMQTTDTSESFLVGLDTRFNVTTVPNPDGTEVGPKYLVESLSTPIPNWNTEAAAGVGSFFSRSNFFLSAIHPDAAVGIHGDGTEFDTVIASFTLRKADFEAGTTYITFLHREPGYFLPAAYRGVPEWTLRFQEDVVGPNEYSFGVGNPGDAGPQWDPYHGYETFQPLIIHNVPESGAGILVLAAMLSVGRRRR